MCEDLRFSLDGMNDKVQGTSAAATPQETGDEPVQRPLATTTPSRLCWTRRQLLTTPVLTSSLRRRRTMPEMQSKFWRQPKVVLNQGGESWKQELNKDPTCEKVLKRAEKTLFGRTNRGCQKRIMVAQSAATSAIAASSTVAGSYHKDWKEFGKDILLQEELAHMISKVTLLEAKLMRNVLQKASLTQRHLNIVSEMECCNGLDGKLDKDSLVHQTLKVTVAQFLKQSKCFVQITA